MTTQAKSSVTMQDAQNKVDELIARSATDLDLRARLIANPRETIAQSIGVAIPETFRIDVVENKADQTFVLPPAVSSPGEIPEHDLEAVAGGTTPLSLAATYWGVVQSVAVATGISILVFKTLNAADEAEKNNPPPPDDKLPDVDLPTVNWGY
jgi:hypothetical protein